MHRQLAKILIILISVISIITYVILQRQSGDVVVWTMVDVSGSKHTGDSHVLEFPDGKAIVIDTGFRYFAEHNLVPLLQRKGIQQIDALIITHAHRNHYGGIKELIKAGIRLEKVYFNQPPKKACVAETWATGCDFEHVQSTFNHLASEGIPVQSLHGGDLIYEIENSDVRLEVLYVFDGINTPVGKTGINDTSALIRLQNGRQSVLFTGDLNIKLGTYLAEHGKNLQAEIMTAPHHGVESAAPNAFYDRVKPNVILASVSSPPLLSPRGKRLREYTGKHDIPLYVSGDHGNVTVKIASDSFNVEVSRNQKASATTMAPLIRMNTIQTGVLKHPAHVMRVNDQYVAAELFNERLVVSSDASFSSPSYIGKARIGTRLRSPHFISSSINAGILVSEGWGNGVIYIPDLNGSDYTSFSGPDGDRLNAPHGVCQSKDGWIYVADSLHSRLIRYKEADGSDFQVFADHDKLVAYGRQLLCRDDGVWLSNSYERREGLNTGEGSNVLKITDFKSGKAIPVVKFRKANMTGIGIINDRWLLVGLWAGTNQTLIVDLNGIEKMSRVPRPDSISGPPYGIAVDEFRKEILISYPGDIMNKTDPGGYVTYSYE